MAPAVSAQAPRFVREVLGMMIAGRGDDLPVSALPVDGTYPTGTTKWEKRNLALEIPVWEPDICIQCGKCAMVCPHGVIRIKAYEPVQLAGAPATFKSTACPRPRVERPEIHHPGGAGRLHRLRHLRRRLPRQEQVRDAAQGPQYAAAAAAARAGKRELGVLPGHPGDGSPR